MGYYSKVRIIMGPKAYELLKNNCLKSNNEDAKDLLRKPYMKDDETIYYDSNDIEQDNAVYIGWNEIKWYERYESISIIMNTLDQLDKIVDDDEYELQDYFYKFMKIGEDNENEELTNDEYGEFTKEYHIICEFSID